MHAARQQGLVARLLVVRIKERSGAAHNPVAIAATLCQSSPISGKRCKAPISSASRGQNRQAVASSDLNGVLSA